MVKRFKNKLCQSATYVISIGIEGGVVHVHRMAEDLQGNLLRTERINAFLAHLVFCCNLALEPFENGKNKHFLAHLVLRCNLVAKSVVLALKGQGKGGVVSALKKTQRLCTEKGGKRNINDQQRRLQPGTSQTYHGSNLNQKGQVELSLKLKVHFL